MPDCSGLEMSLVSDVCERLTTEIVRQLKTATSKWERPWSGQAALPYSIQTGHPYTGSNVLALWVAQRANKFSSHAWGTLKQWAGRRGRVHPGSRGTKILWPRRRLRGTRTGWADYFWAVTVFNGDQIDNYSEAHPDLFETVSARPKIDEILSRLPDCVTYAGSRAVYSPTLDKIGMPPNSSFVSTQFGDATHGFYSTLLHEFCHWTGHPERLNRRLGFPFGSAEYAFEELVAELGAALLLAHTGVCAAPREDHAVYIKSWIGLLESDPTALSQAAGEAQKAVVFLLEYPKKGESVIQTRAETTA